MANFSDREKGFESKWALDEELSFKVHARRNKLLGLWVAELLGLKENEADAYAKEVVKSDFQEAGDEDVFQKIDADLKERGVDVSEHRIRRQMQDLLEEAHRQIVEQNKK